MMQFRILAWPRHSLLVAGLLTTLSNPATAVTIRHDLSYNNYDQNFLVSSGSGYQDIFNSVGKLTWSNYLCSGTAIAQDWVLTAAHCLDENTVAPGDYSFTLGNLTFNGAAKQVYPSWNSNDLGAGGDLALLQLNQPITNLSSFPTLWETNQGNLVGELGTTVGFGQTGNGSTGATGSSGVKHAVQNVIDAYGNGQDRYGNNFGLAESIFLADFDRPWDWRQRSNRIGGLWTSYEGSIAPGDSGGSLFVQNKLAGIVSFGWGAYDGQPNSSYGDLFGYTGVPFFTNWIYCTISNPGTSCPTNNPNPSSQTVSESKSSRTLQDESTRVPETMSPLSLLALGTIGAASTLKRKRKLSKSCEKKRRANRSNQQNAD